MLKSGLGLILAVSLATSAAYAQEAEKPAKQPQNPAAAGRADALLKAAEATDLFENVTENVAAVKHTASGLICSFDDTPTARVILYPNPVRGNDVGCTSLLGDVLISLYATKYPADAELQNEFMGTLGVLKTIYPDLKGYEGTVADIAQEGAPKDETAYFLIIDKEGRMTGKPGTEVLSRLSMALVRDGWMVKIRASTPNSDEQAGMKLSAIAGAAWMRTLMEYAPAKTAEPVPPKPEDSPPTL